MRLIICAIIFLASCADKQRFVEVKGEPGKNGTSCESVDADGGIFIICGNSQPIFIADGKDGINGSDGKDGLNGTDGIDATISPI